MRAVLSKLLAMARRSTGIKLVRTVKDGALVQNTRIGPAAEALRRMSIDQLKGHMEAFYEHGTLPDLLLLCAAFDRIERERVNWVTGTRLADGCAAYDLQLLSAQRLRCRIILHL